MNSKQMRSIIEGLLFAAGDEGLEARELAEAMEVSKDEVVSSIAAMKREFKTAQRGVQIVEWAGNYQLTTLPEHATYFQKLAYSPSRGSLSQAALETLAIIAYRQPITRIDIEEIRGVSSERAVQTLVAKQLVHAVARSEAIGRPILYGTTEQFLEYFGLNALDDLPDSSELEASERLEEETRQLFEKWDNQQLTIDDLK